VTGIVQQWDTMLINLPTLLLWHALGDHWNGECPMAFEKHAINNTRILFVNIKNQN